MHRTRRIAHMIEPIQGRDSPLRGVGATRLITVGAVNYLPKPIGESDLRVMHAMYRLHLDFPFMGSRQLTRALGQRGYRVGRLHVRTLMIKMGISAIAPQPGTVILP